jgi:hypothetical protein
MHIFWYDDEKNIYKTHIDALISGKNCFLYYNDTLYNTVDWKTEPSLSLDELYKLRAQEIRDSYEKVILCLSGGIDSRNVLESFYYNNIHIDEILSVGAFSQDKYFGSDENNNKEIYVNVKQLLNNMNLPETKKTFIDYTEHYKDPFVFNTLKHKEDYWYTELGCWKSFHNLFWKDLKKYVIHDNKKTCFVMGTGKTQVNVYGSHPFVMFNDADITDYGFNYQDENLHRENFYWGNTHISAEIIKKQAFVMLKVYQNIPQKNSFTSNYEKIYNKIVYNLRNPLEMPTKKSKSFLLSIRDEFMKRKTDSEMYKYYTEGLKKMAKDVGLSHKIHTTKRYYLKGLS